MIDEIINSKLTDIEKCNAIVFSMLNGLCDLEEGLESISLLRDTVSDDLNCRVSKLEESLNIK